MQTETIPGSALFERAAAFGSLGWRLVQICCTRRLEGMELTYTFDKENNPVHLRTNWTAGEAVPSIQAVYSCAFIYENEIAELFGVTISDMAVDFKGRFYTTARPSPFGAGISIQEA
jgi:ech hydrogenase subunit D